MDQTLMKNNIDQNTLNLLKRIEDYEKTYNNYKMEIEKQKKKEITRINKEFITNDYQRRFNATLHTLISAIYGVDNMSAEYSKLIREQKVNFFLFNFLIFIKIIKNYFDKIKLCQSHHNTVQKNNAPI
jgi:hypothetical protein